MVWCEPIRHKSENTEKIKTILRDINARYSTHLGQRIVRYLRSDNEPVWDGHCIVMLLDSSVQPLRPPPYTPAWNGVVEREVREFVTGLRAMLTGTDIILWCYASEHLAAIKRSLPGTGKTSQGRTPRQQVAQELGVYDPQENLSGIELLESLPFRTFGSLCVCYVADPLQGISINLRLTHC